MVSCRSLTRGRNSLSKSTTGSAGVRSTGSPKSRMGWTDTGRLLAGVQAGRPFYEVPRAPVPSAAAVRSEAVPAGRDGTIPSGGGRDGHRHRRPARRAVRRRAQHSGARVVRRLGRGHPVAHVGARDDGRHARGRFLTAVVAMLRPSTVLEIGTFTGYSSLSMAEALPPGGRIITCDISEEHVAIAREHIGASPYADRIEIRVGPAIETIAGLDGPFDLVFIDADKAGYLGYYEAVLPKLAPDGVILADNVLWSGRLVEGPTPDEDASTRALREFNDHLVADERVEVVMLTIRDGVSIIRRRR